MPVSKGYDIYSYFMGDTVNLVALTDSSNADNNSELLQQNYEDFVP